MKNNKFIIKINKEKCLGCGTCAALCPGAFSIGNDHKSSVNDNHRYADEEILMAAKSCPTGAIELYRENKKIWPEG